MAILGSSLLDGFLESAKATGKMIKNSLGKEIPEMVRTFKSGFVGSGWKIWNSGVGKEEYTAEFDNLRIRGTMAVHELIIQKIRAICGALGISQACGKVESVSEDSNNYYFTLEGEDTSGYGGFMEGDLIRCQRWTNKGIKGYWVEVSSVSGDGRILTIKKSEFNGIICDENEKNGGEQVSNLNNVNLVYRQTPITIGRKNLTVSKTSGFSNMETPAKGDEIVQYGNTKNEKRRTAVYIHATEGTQPAMDILFGIKEKSFAGCLKVRLGGGLPDNGGVGLYCEEGHIIAKSGAEVLYEMKPDGYFNLGKGKLIYDPIKDTLTLGEDTIIQWTPPEIESATEYAVSHDATTPPTSGWSKNFPSSSVGMFVWSRTRVQYADGSSQGEYIYSVSRVGSNGVNGKDGTDGKDGINGINGKDGKTTYFHIKYSPVASPTAEQMTETPNTYIGTYVDFLPNDSSNPNDYTWSRFEGLQGKDGTNGIPGKNGADGRTSYLHIKYSNDGGKTLTDNNGEEAGSWIGQYTDYVQQDSMDVAKYNWSKIKGEKGDKGEQGLRGLQGDKGEQGIPGTNGTNGKDGTSISITSASVLYAISDTNVRPDDNKFIYSKIPDIEKGKWIWTKTEVIYSDNTKTISYSASYVGEDGLNVGRNLLDYTGFVFKPQYYSGELLNFEGQNSNISPTAVLSDDGIGGSRCASAKGNASAYVDLFYTPIEFKPSTWYTLSFYMRGDDLHTFVYPDIVDTSVQSVVDGASVTSKNDGFFHFAKTTEWKRHFFTFKTKASFSGQKNILFRIPQNGGNVRLCLPVLDENERAYIKHGTMLCQDSMVVENAINGTNALYSSPSQRAYAEIFTEDVHDRISAGGDYTLSFLSKGSGSIVTFVWSGGNGTPLDSNKKSIADGIEEPEIREDGYHRWPLTDGWVKHSYTFRTTKNLPSIVYVLFRVMGGDSANICQAKLESGTAATEWMESENDRTLRLPNWVDEWDSNATSINGQRVVAPQAFFGEKKDGKLTGVIMGARAVTIDGVSKNGLYALNNNNVMVAIDPTTGKYLFRGTLIADTGQFNGMVFGSYYKSNAVVTEENFPSLFKTREHYKGGGNIVVPEWARLAQVVIFNKVPDNTGYDVSIHLPPYYYNNETIPSEEDYAMGLSMLGSTLVLINRTSGKDSSQITLNGKFQVAGQNTIKSSITLGSESSLYLTCKIASNGIIYYESNSFNEASNVPKFNGVIVPFKPDIFMNPDFGSLS